jgi:hypothetical protein
MLAGTTVPGDEIVMKQVFVRFFVCVVMMIVAQPLCQGELISRASSTDDDAMHDWNAHCQKEIFALMKRELKNPELESLLVDKMRKLLEQTPAEQRGAVNMEDFTMHAQQVLASSQIVYINNLLTLGYSFVRIGSSSSYRTIRYPNCSKELDCSVWVRTSKIHSPHRKVTCPILALFGEKDLQVSSANVFVFLFVVI